MPSAIFKRVVAEQEFIRRYHERQRELVELYEARWKEAHPEESDGGS